MADDVKDQWRPCADWLFRCLAELPEILHQAQAVLSDPQATVVDLLTSLKDGVLLCHILPALSRQEISIASLEGFKLMTLNSPFVFKNNIRIFLKHCESFFEMKKADLFKAEELLGQENIIGIVRSLSALSQCPKARLSGVAGFELRRSQDELEYYSFVADSRPQVCVEEPVYEKDYGAQEEKVYDSIINVRRPEPAKKAGLGPREMCEQEVIDTECSYVNTLRMLVDSVLRPMKSKQSAWSPGEVEEIFKLLPELLALHQKLLQDLQIAIMLKADRAKTLPEVFLAFKDRLLVYGKYCSHLASAQKLVENACRCDRRKAEELQLHLANCHAKFKLSEYLTLPMQRILKYHLLLQTLLKIEEKSGQPESPALRVAYAEMCEVADYINEVKRDLEMMALIDQIQNNVDDLEVPTGMRLINYGRLQLDEELKVVSDLAKPASGSKLRYCFLWNRMFMLVKSKGQNKDGYVFKDVFAINADLTVEQLEYPSPGKRADTKWLWLFTVTAPKTLATQERTMHFLAKTRESRQRWVEAFGRAKAEQAPPNYNAHGHYFEQCTFDEPTYCSACRKLMRGCFYQGYKCRKTGLVVHAACIPSKPARAVSEIIARPHGDARALGSPVRHSDFVDAVAAAQPAPPPRIPPSVSEESVSSPRRHTMSHALSDSGAQFRCPPPRSNSLEGHYLAPYDWFVGTMSREEARDALIGQPVGTFLVRQSKNSSVDYAISLRYRETIKHMRVERSDASYYLGEARNFPSIPALVTYYSLNSLNECFAELDTVLAKPYRPRTTQRCASISTSTPKQNSVVGWAVAVQDYAGPAGHISLAAGETVALLTQRDTQLWRGRKPNGQVGLFPAEAVRPVSSNVA